MEISKKKMEGISKIMETFEGIVDKLDEFHDEHDGNSYVIGCWEHVTADGEDKIAGNFSGNGNVGVIKSGIYNAMREDERFAKIVLWAAGIYAMEEIKKNSESQEEQQTEEDEAGEGEES